MTAQLDFTRTSTQTMHLGDCLEVMRTFPDNSIDFIVTDPPYGLHFMGKTWDKFKQNRETQKPCKQFLAIDGYTRIVKPITCANSKAGTYDENRNDEFQQFIKQFGIESLRILKPGSHIAMFGAPRRYHRQMSGLEDAGFEIRDVVMWLCGQGFPKSYNHFGLPGYGTALKPAYEPIIMAMKPLDGTYAQNAQKWGLAGINIDDSRIDNKRWPANLILDEDAAELLDQQTGILKSRKVEKHHKHTGKEKGIYGKINGGLENETYGNSGGASRFFYCAKASSAERNKGLENMPIKQNNFHPTVKPIALMKYIIKLLAPPGNPTLLDPFAGSGSTLLAAKKLDINAVGIEKEEEYYNIARTRVEHG